MAAKPRSIVERTRFSRLLAAPTTQALGVLRAPRVMDTGRWKKASSPSATAAMEVPRFQVSDSGILDKQGYGVLASERLVEAEEVEDGTKQNE